MRSFYPLRLLFCLVALLCLRPMLSSAAPFTPGNIVVARVGDGTAALTTGATAVYLDEYTPAGVLVQSIDLPTSVSGNNRILTASGSTSSELGLARTANGRNLVLAGYSAAPGTSAVAASLSTDVARVIGLIAPNGTLDTSTSLGSAFSGVSVRAVASTDGTSFYAVGGNSGVQYVQLAGFAPTQINTAPANIRTVDIVAGNLYIATASNPYIGLNVVGTGLPTTGPQTAAALPGFPATVTGSSPYGFYFADLSSAVAGIDVVYVADDRSATGGGIQKWSLVAGSWVLNGTIAGSATATVRGLDGTTTGTTVSLVATSPTSLYVLADNTGYNVAPTLATLPTAVATASTNTAFRGITFAPAASAPTIVSFSPASGPVGTTVTVTGTNLDKATGATLNGLAVSKFMVMSATSVMFDVPVAATSGPIVVTTPDGPATSATAFTVIAPNPVPVITTITPATAVAGTAVNVTITGTGFSASSVMNVNGTLFPSAFVSATQLTATVPANTPAGTYTVTVVNPTPGGGTSNAVTFILTQPPPTVASFTPTMGGPGTSVTITGTNFLGATAVLIGSFNVPDFKIVSATSITLVLPSSTGNVTGFIKVTTPSGTGTSQGTFNLVTATAPGGTLVKLAVYPNPASEFVTLTLPQTGAATVMLSDLAGRVILAPATLAADQRLRLPASLPAGLYLLGVRQGATMTMCRIEKN